MGSEPQASCEGGAGDLVGETLGRTYRITSLLDEGGMGSIYAAEHLRLRRQVAIKVLVRRARDERALERFYREAALISRLQHPHIVSVIDFDTTESGEPYLVMERLVGETLEQRLEILGDGVPLSLDEAVTIATEVASALTAAHQADIIHRDLKPANIFLSQVDGHGEVTKLLDFGIGKHLTKGPGQRKLTGEFDLLGTPDYMSPEQALGDNARVDSRTDQWALAAITFEMVSGQRPFRGDKLHELLQSIVHGEVPSVATTSPRPLPPELDAIFQRGLARKPEDRFPNANEFAAALTQVAGAAAVISSRPTDPAPPMTGSPSEGGTETEERRPPPISGRASRVRRRETLPSQDEMESTSQNEPRALIDLAERAKRALDDGDVADARVLADDALAMIDESDDPALKSMLSLTSSLYERIYEGVLGGLDVSLNLARKPSAADELSPGEAYLLSRLDGGLVLVDLLVLSPTDRLATLRSLVALCDAGIVRPAIEGHA